MTVTLQDKVVLITGAGRGVGRSLAEFCCHHGAIVAAVDITPINVDPLVASMRANGFRAHAYYHDIAKKVDVQAMVINIQNQLGRIDILINCANVNFPGAILDIDEWDLHRVFEVNAIGTLLTIQSVGRVMRQQGGGAIINVISIRDDSSSSTLASRGGLVALNESLQAELAPFGIQVHTCQGADSLEKIKKILM